MSLILSNIKFLRPDTSKGKEVYRKYYDRLQLRHTKHGEFPALHQKIHGQRLQSCETWEWCVITPTSLDG